MIPTTVASVRVLRLLKRARGGDGESCQDLSLSEDEESDGELEDSLSSSVHPANGSILPTDMLGNL